MAVTNLKTLIGKLNPACNKALTNAAGLASSRTNYNVEIEHWLIKLLEPTDGDLPRVLKHYQIEPSRVINQLTRALDSERTGNAKNPSLSQEIVDCVREAWNLASLEYNWSIIRSGHLLAAILGDRNLGGRIRQSSAELAKIKPEDLQRDLPALVKGTAEDDAPIQQGPTGDPGQPGQQVKPGSKTPNLDQYTMDLTDRAKKGQIDPVIGREPEIRQVIDILTRRRQNNPILTGEAGVGKTAVVEGFALRVAEGDVPEALKNVRVLTLDLTLLQAGAGVKGEFENRLKSVISEVKGSPIPIILFIDEAHTMIGAGGQAGQGDAANILKPALARGELRTIAATTWAEYKKYFEDDAALKRRFQVVKVAEPEVDNAIRMMRGLTGMLEKHHKVRILAEAVEDAVKLSARYITDRQLPDKSISLLDTACARVALSQVSTPPAIEDCKREIQHADVELGILAREQAVGAEHSKRVAEVTEGKKKAEERLAALEKQFEAEKKLAAELRDIRDKLEGHASGKAKLSEADEAKYKAELAAKSEELLKVQGDHALVQPFVNSGAVAEIVSSWTGVPLGKMVLNEMKTVLELEKHLGARVVGQDHALYEIAKRIKTSRAQLGDPGRPLGVFMLAGPSGVGKTETALALSDILYGGEKNVVVINMSEYKDSSSVSNLKGSAKGLVGYGSGGVLTEAVRRTPYSIVLLDEVEKAHVDVQELFYQVFDKGMLQDSSGNDVDFKNTIILLTSNAGTDVIKKLCADPETAPDPETLRKELLQDLLTTKSGPTGQPAFKPAFLGRTVIVPYYPLSDEVMKKIIRLKLKKIGNRFAEHHRAAFSYDDKVVDTVAARCTEADTGARNVDNILTGSMLPELANEVLAKMAEGATITKAHVSVGADGGFTYAIS